MLCVDEEGIASWLEFHDAIRYMCLYCAYRTVCFA